MPGISLHDAIHGQRAIRRFSTDPVPQEAIEQVLAAAARAPSGGNRQQWSFVVIRDDALKRRIGEWYLDGWNVTYASDPTRPRNATYASAETLAHNLAATPVLLLACINRGWAYEKLGQGEWALRDYRKAHALGNRLQWLLGRLRQSGALP